MKGFKTFAYGFAVAVLPAAMQYIGGVDPVATFGVSPSTGAMIGAGIMALRAVTNSAVFKRK